MDQVSRRRPSRRLPALAAVVALLGFLAVGCGVEGKDVMGGDTSGADTPSTSRPADTTDDLTDEVTDVVTDDYSDYSDDYSDYSDYSDDFSDYTDDFSDFTDDFSDDVTDFGSEDAIRDTIVDLYTEMGLSPDQAGCLADKFVGSGSAGTPDMSESMQWFEDCNISISDFGG